uniref:Uncharacterized protein n=1 Tax=Octopus bimaculoides TaxID=37653 RepID=A0A0L8I549_OCTBM
MTIMTLIIIAIILMKTMKKIINRRNFVNFLFSFTENNFRDLRTSPNITEKITEPDQWKQISFGCKDDHNSV